MRPAALLRVALCTVITGASTSRAVSSAAAHVVIDSTGKTSATMAGREVAILAGGCWWCLEASFHALRGVDSAISGSINGHVPHPTYEALCTGDTGHAEAVKVTFDPSVLPYTKLLDVFFTIHDPTQLNRQGNDYGTQYRSGIYYLDEKQRDEATAYIRELQKAYGATPIVTEVVPAQTFYPAEEYHQRYYEKNPSAGYCRAVVRPKLEKTRAKFSELLK